MNQKTFQSMFSAGKSMSNHIGLGLKKPSISQLGLKSGLEHLVGLGRKISSISHSVIDNPISSAIGSVPVISPFYMGAKTGLSLFDKGLNMAANSSKLAQLTDDGITSLRKKINPTRR